VTTLEFHTTTASAPPSEDIYDVNGVEDVNGPVFFGEVTGLSRPLCKLHKTGTRPLGI